jgi:hypothetical protein
MGTVASVDQQNQTVRLTDGSSVRVSPSTKMRMGAEGATIVLTDLKPGDELIIVLMDAPPTASGSGSPSTAAPSTSAGQASPGASSTTGTGTRATADPSALPRAAVTGSPSDPSDASELMVFREVQAP